MKTLQISEKKARELYSSASTEFRILLVENFGKEFFTKEITERIKTYEDCCRELEEEPVNEEAMLKAGFTPDEIIYRKLKTITNAINEGHKPNMLDTNEYKWFPVFRVDPSSPSGFVFYSSHYVFSDALAGGASRLCFKTEALADFAGKAFPELYINFIK